MLKMLVEMLRLSVEMLGFLEEMLLSHCIYYSEFGALTERPLLKRC